MCTKLPLCLIHKATEITLYFHNICSVFLKKTLYKWKDSRIRMPLIVRGARQVGKTFIIEAFGREEFKNYVNINFESSSIYRQCFEHLIPALS